jgi:predicted dehydrogenase
MVLSADWQQHLGRTRPLLLAGCPTFVDKPLAGSVQELDAFIDLAEETQTPLMAGSGWRFAQPIQQAHDKFSISEIDHVLTVMHRHYMYYGIHSVEMALGLLGPGIDSVEMVKKGNTVHILEFSHKKGPRGHFLLSLEQDCFFYGIRFTAEAQSQRISFEAEDVHNGVCETFVKMVKNGKSSLRPNDLAESVRVLLAGLQSWQHSAPVKLADLSLDAHYDSTNFMDDYIVTTQKARQQQ